MCHFRATAEHFIFFLSWQIFVLHFTTLHILHFCNWIKMRFILLHLWARTKYISLHYQSWTYNSLNCGIVSWIGFDCILFFSTIHNNILFMSNWAWVLVFWKSVAGHIYQINEQTVSSIYVFAINNLKKSTNLFEWSV